MRRKRKAKTSIGSVLLGTVFCWGGGGKPKERSVYPRNVLMAVKSSTRASPLGFGEPSEVLSQRSSLEEWSRIGLGSLQKSSHKDPLYKSGFNGLQPSSFFYVFLFVWCLFCCCRFLLSCLVRGLRRNSRKSIPPSVV